ncbi:MAG: hypothetical protein IKF71_04275 [Bacilli bacterium]|nr:hypothetical protein [Bacilli bacterium]
MRREKKVLGTAILHVKCNEKMMSLEESSFEEFISSPDTFIKIDLLDGRSLIQDGYRSNFMPSERYYIEFYDSYSVGDLLSYLMCPESDFRATSLDGTIVRMSQHDLKMIPKEVKNDPSREPSKEYVYMSAKNGLFHKVWGSIGKKR